MITIIMAEFGKNMMTIMRIREAEAYIRTERQVAPDAREIIVFVLLSNISFEESVSGASMAKLKTPINEP
jgi:hypothetical protein